MLRELDETQRDWESVRWVVSAIWVARRERLRQRPVRTPRPWADAPASLRLAIRIAASALAALVVIAGVDQFLVTTVYLPAGGMAPTIGVGDWAVVDRVAFRVTGLDRGDVVQARFASGNGGGPLLMIRRVIGLPGDTISCADGQVIRNGSVVVEDYLAPGTTTRCDAITVPLGELYLLGDARAIAWDSRQSGSVAISEVTGRVVAST
jgi:signal peptidase I